MKPILTPCLSTEKRKTLGIYFLVQHLPEDPAQIVQVPPEEVIGPVQDVKLGSGAPLGRPGLYLVCRSKIVPTADDDRVQTLNDRDVGKIHKPNRRSNQHDPKTAGIAGLRPTGKYPGTE